jgi:hypothetical protein
MAMLEGTMFIVQVARELAQHGLRPQTRGPIPKPRYVPLTRPPAKAVVNLG